MWPSDCVPVKHKSIAPPEIISMCLWGGKVRTLVTAPPLLAAGWWANYHGELDAASPVTVGFRIEPTSAGLGLVCVWNYRDDKTSGSTRLPSRKPQMLVLVFLLVSSGGVGTGSGFWTQDKLSKCVQMWPWYRSGLTCAVSSRCHGDVMVSISSEVRGGNMRSYDVVRVKVPHYQSYVHCMYPDNFAVNWLWSPGGQEDDCSIWGK